MVEIKVKRLGPKPQFAPSRYKEKPPKLTKPTTFAELHKQRGTENDSAASQYKRKSWSTWTMVDLYTALALAEQGLTSEQIAERIHKTPQAVNKKIGLWRKAHGLSPRVGGRPLGRKNK